jgi:hypothetical protein
MHMATGTRRIHIIGAGPVGLLLAAMLQQRSGFDIKLYEKRQEYVRTRMVRLAPYLVADSIDAYRVDPIDGDNVEAVFEQWELEESLAFRMSMAPDLRSLLVTWTHGFVRLNDIETALSALIDAGGPSPVQRIEANLTIDCTGCKSLLRDHLVPYQGSEPAPEANTVNIRLEYAAVVTFLLGRPYECNEYCKYYKNLDNSRYKFIPAVDRTCYDDGLTHVTGIVNISEKEFASMPAQCEGDYLRENFPGVASSMDRFIEKVCAETNGDIVGDLEIIRIPLNLYHAVNSTSRRWQRQRAHPHPFLQSPVFLLGDAAIGSPYFQSISLGFECAMFLAGLLDHDEITMDEALERYEWLMYKQWLRVYMRSKLIKHNKDLFESVDDTFGLLEKLHIY